MEAAGTIDAADAASLITEILFYIVRVQGVDISALYTINNDQRTTGLAEAGITTDMIPCVASGAPPCVEVVMLRLPTIPCKAWLTRVIGRFFQFFAIYHRQ